MSITVQTGVRHFWFNSVPLPDPGSEFSVEEVRDVYSAQYPDITTANLEAPLMTEDGVKYTFVRNVGTKG